MKQDVEGRSGWRTFLIILFTAVALLSAILLNHYALWNNVKPSELDLGKVLLFSLAGVAVLTVPWREIGCIPTE